MKAECARLRMIDLNLFRVFDAMMLHRSVRKASQILSVTPSAVSHALSRLRQSIGQHGTIHFVGRSVVGTPANFFSATREPDRY
jgi:Bacterial regulatory helix-turn-helix protein, lysR family